MNAEEFIAKFLNDHLGATITLVALSASVKLANFLAKKWPIPPATAPWWKRAAHFVLVNWPSWGDELEGEVKGLQTRTKSLPFVSFTARPPEDPVDKARAVLGEKKPEEPKQDNGGYTNIGIVLCIAASTAIYVLVLLCTGCGPTSGYVRALQVKGEVSDAVVEAHVGWSQMRQMMHDNIRSQATSYADGLAQLDKLRQKEAKADATLIAGREAVRKYSEALAVVGAAKRSDWTGAILEVVTAITTMVAALAEFDVHIKWAPPSIDSKPVTQAVQRGYEHVMARTNKCYTFSKDENDIVRFHRVNCSVLADAPRSAVERRQASIHFASFIYGGAQ